MNSYRFSTPLSPSHLRPWPSPRSRNRSARGGATAHGCAVAMVTAEAWDLGSGESASRAEGPGGRSGWEPGDEWASLRTAAGAGAGGEGASAAASLGFASARAFPRGPRPADSLGDLGGSLSDSGRKRTQASRSDWRQPRRPSWDAPCGRHSVSSSSGLPLFNPRGPGLPFRVFSLSWDLKFWRDHVFWRKNSSSLKGP